MSPFSTVHGGQHDTKHVTFELLLVATLVADDSLGSMLQAARKLFSLMLEYLSQTCDSVTVGIFVYWPERLRSQLKKMSGSGFWFEENLRFSMLNAAGNSRKFIFNKNHLSIHTLRLAHPKTKKKRGVRARRLWCVYLPMSPNAHDALNADIAPGKTQCITYNQKQGKPLHTYNDTLGYVWRYDDQTNCALGTASDITTGQPHILQSRQSGFLFSQVDSTWNVNMNE